MDRISFKELLPKIILILCLIFVLNVSRLSSLFSDEVQEPTIDFLLQKYSDYLKWFDDYSVTIEKDGTTLIRNWKNHNIRKCDIVKYQNKWKIDQTITIEHLNHSDSLVNLTEEDLYDDNLKLYSGKNERDGEDVSVIAKRIDTESQNILKELAKEFPCWFFLGYEFFTLSEEDNELEFFPDILHKAISEGAKTKVSTNENVVQLNIDADLFHAELEFVPELNYAVRKVLFLRLGDTVDDMRTVYSAIETKEFVEIETFYVPKILHWRSFSSLENQPFVPFVDSHINIDNASETPFGLKKESYEENDEILIWSDLKKLHRAPKMSLGNLFSIPNGTNVTMIGEEQLEYVWMDDKVVLKTDENMLRIATEGHKFIPSPKESRFWFILIGLAAVLTVGGMRLYQFWRED